MASIITLTTDFGLEDVYVSVMKGVILGINPQATIIDITHAIEPQDILQAAFILNIAYRYFPAQTIHTAVVDPGVGSECLRIIVKTPTAFFVVPDNGILSYVIDELCPGVFDSARRDETLQNNSFRVTIKDGLEIAAITDPRFWRHPVSSTFHGRDIFAPVAAGLSLDISIYEFGDKITSLLVLPIPKPYCESQGNLIGQVLHVDHFGNLITNIKNSDLLSPTGTESLIFQESLNKPSITIAIAGRLIQGLSSYYAQAEGLIAIMGSSGYLEISFKNGSAQDVLGTGIGEEVTVISS